MTASTGLRLSVSPSVLTLILHGGPWHSTAPRRTLAARSGTGRPS